ncbi:MAG: COX15/CtaA family protein, partial [Anaerolineae bacterium]|nr:COX15/CtaA family protein [Anaerolineae bacterium]
MSNRNPLPLTTNRNLQLLAAATVIGSLAAFGVGSVAQQTISGAWCPGWTLCFGQPAPPPPVTLWLDLAHFAAAGLLAVLAVTLSLAAQQAAKHHPAKAALHKLSLGSVILGFLFLVATLLTISLAGHPLIRTFYLLVGLGYIGLSFGLITVISLPATRFSVSPAPSDQHQRSFLWLVLDTGLLLALVTIGGVLVTETGAGAACPDWPLCQGRIIPAELSGPVLVSLAHRYLVLIAGILMAAVVLRTCRDYAKQPILVRWAAISGLLYLSQIAVGGWNVLLPVSPVIINALHLVLTIAIWGSLAILAFAFYALRPALSVTAEDKTAALNLTIRQRARVYFKLTKPWIMVLLLVTTVGAMFIAAKGLPSLPLILLTTLGGALASGGASVLNSYVDSDIDRMMSRTARRATVTGLVTPKETLYFGLILSTLSFFVYALFVNTLSAALSTLGILYYVFFYTLYLKRSTIHNIIIGGAAGAIPPLVGWTAVTGRLDLAAFYL